MDNIEDKLNIATKTKLGVVQIKNTVAVSAADNAKITKVLTASAKPRIENVLVDNMEVKFEGVVDYEFLVVLDDNQIVPLSQKSNFSQIFENAQITPETCVCLTSEVIELNNITSAEIIYSSVINFSVYATNSNNDITLPQVPENVFIKEGEVIYNSLAECITYDGRVEFELAKDSKTSKILFATSFATIKNLMPSNNYFVVSGEVISTVVYENEDGTIKHITKESNFSEEIEAQGATKESNIQASIETRETIIVENTDKNVFNFDVPIQICAQVFSSKSGNCIVDAYSLTNQINLTTTSFVKNEFFTTRDAEENIVTNFVLDESAKPIDKILAVVPNNIWIVNQIVKEHTLLIEGIANINIIYYYLDEENSDILNSIDVEVPYSIELNVDDLMEGDQVISQIILGDVSVKNKMGRELEILACAKINYSIIKEKVSAVVTNLEIGEEKQQKDYALEVYVAHDNQTLWDIAKELNISSTDIVRQNGELTLPIKEGEKIVAYNQRVVEYD